MQGRVDVGEDFCELLDDRIPHQAANLLQLLFELRTERARLARVALKQVFNVYTCSLMSSCKMHFIAHLSLACKRRHLVAQVLGVVAQAAHRHVVGAVE